MKTYTKEKVRDLIRQALCDADSMIDIDLEDGYVEIRKEEFENWCKQYKV